MTFENIRLAVLELFTRRKASLNLQIGSATGDDLQSKKNEIARLETLLTNSTWHPDPGWLASLPTLLCGPIVRKVLTDEVTVWVAFKTSVNVTLTIFERKNDGQKGNVIFSGSLQTVRVGEHLHLAAVRAKPDAPTSANKLLRGNIYYYNLTWGGESLETHRAELVYGDKDPLPSFMVPPLQLNALRILHGSCRNVDGNGYDAFPNLDHLLGRRGRNAAAAETDRTAAALLFLTLTRFIPKAKFSIARPCGPSRQRLARRFPRGRVQLGRGVADSR